MQKINHTLISNHVLEIMNIHFSTAIEFKTPDDQYGWIPRGVSSYYIKKKLIKIYDIDINYKVLNYHLKKMVNENQIDFIKRKSTNTYSLKKLNGYKTRGHFFERKLILPEVEMQLEY